MTDPTPREVARRYTRRAFSVLRVAAGLASAADRDVARLGRQLQGIVAGYDLDDIGRRELAALLREVEAAVALAYGTIGAWQLASISELLEIEATWAARVLGGRDPSDTAIARALRDLLILGAPLAEHWTRQGDNLTQRVLDIIRDAANGVPGPIADAIRDAIAQAQRDATALADVGVSSAAQAGRAETARANGAIAWRWISVLDGRTTTGCAIRNGLVYGFDYSPIGHTIPIERPPPRHWGCLLGDTHVSASSRVTGVFERRYDGDIVVIRTAGGNEISVTPNHPILTRRGWVPAGLINEGDGVACRVVGQDVFIAGNPDGVNMPPRFEDVANALRRSGNMGSVPVPLSAEDFHGDGKGSEVAVVWSDSNLGRQINASLQKHFGEFALEVGCSGDAALLPSLGGPAQRVKVVAPTALGSVSGSGVGPSLLGSKLGGTQNVGFASAAHRDVVGLEDAHDWHDRYAVAIGEHGGAIASQVFSANLLLGKLDKPDSVKTASFDHAIDDALADASLALDLSSGNLGPVEFSAVIQKTVREYSGHVYNLETEQGAYCANGIIVHNCRSILIPLQRMPQPGDVDFDQTFEEWLGSLSREEQDDVLGKGKADLYRRGVITKRDLVDQRGRELTLRELRGRAD